MIRIEADVARKEVLSVNLPTLGSTVASVEFAIGNTIAFFS